MRHIFTDELSHLARSIELTFWRIERDSHSMRPILSGLIAGLAVAMVAWFYTEGELLLFGCLGSSTASVVFAPRQRSNSLRVQSLAYAVAAMTSAILYPIHHHLVGLPVAAQCGLAVGLSVTAMRLLNVMHPAAVGGALSFVIYERNLLSLALLLGAIIAVLIIVKIFIYTYLEELEFKDFKLEFSRDYYGRELQVTVLPDGAQTKASDAATTPAVSDDDASPSPTESP